MGVWVIPMSGPKRRTNPELGIYWHSTVPVWIVLGDGSYRHDSRYKRRNYSFFLFFPAFSPPRPKLSIVGSAPSC